MSDHTTAETRQTFRCKECVSKDADIARLTAELENWEKDYILFRKMLEDKTSQFLALQSATRKVVEASEGCLAALHFEATDVDGTWKPKLTKTVTAFQKIVSALADPVIVALRKEE